MVCHFDNFYRVYVSQQSWIPQKIYRLKSKVAQAPLSYSLLFPHLGMRDSQLYKCFLFTSQPIVWTIRISTTYRSILAKCRSLSGKHRLIRTPRLTTRLYSLHTQQYQRRTGSQETHSFMSIPQMEDHKLCQVFRR